MQLRSLLLIGVVWIASSEASALPPVPITFTVNPQATSIDVLIEVFDVEIFPPPDPLIVDLDGTDTVSGFGTVDATLRGLTTQGGTPYLRFTSANLSLGDLEVNLLDSVLLGTLDVNSTHPTNLRADVSGPTLAAEGVPAGSAFDFDIGGAELTLDGGVLEIDANGAIGDVIPDVQRNMALEPLTNLIEPGTLATLTATDQGGGLFAFTLTVQVNAQGEIDEISCPDDDPPTCVGGYANRLTLTGPLVMTGSAILPPPPTVAAPALSPLGTGILVALLALVGTARASRLASAPQR